MVCKRQMILSKRRKTRIKPNSVEWEGEGYLSIGVEALHRFTDTYEGVTTTMTTKAAMATAMAKAGSGGEGKKGRREAKRRSMWSNRARTSQDTAQQCCFQSMGFSIRTMEHSLPNFRISTNPPV